METWEWIAIAVGIGAVVVVLVGTAFVMLRRRRRSHLKDRFGPEYDHAVSVSGQRDAERQLTDIEDKHAELEIRPLPAPARDRYLEEWRQAESRFVSDPQDAVRAADRIVIRVLEERGYPAGADMEERSAHVAADHPVAVQRYRHAYDMVHEADHSTESLRKAMVDLRIVLDELLVGEPATV